MKQLRRVWSGRPEDAEHRRAVLRGMRAQSMEFSELNVEYGYSYESAAVVRTAPAAGPVDDIRVYHRRPGPAHPYLTPGSMTTMATAGRSRISWRRAVPADRGRTATRGARRPGARHGGKPASRRGADRSPRRRRLRPALRVAAPARDPKRRRDPRSTRPLHRLATGDVGEDPRSALAGALSQILARPIHAPVPTGATAR